MTNPWTGEEEFIKLEKACGFENYETKDNEMYFRLKIVGGYIIRVYLRSLNDYIQHTFLIPENYNRVSLKTENNTLQIKLKPLPELAKTLLQESSEYITKPNLERAEFDLAKGIIDTCVNYIEATRNRKEY